MAETQTRDAADSGIDSVQQTTTNVVEQIGSLAKAWVEANTAFWLGSVKVSGELMRNASEGARTRVDNQTGDESGGVDRMIRNAADNLTDSVEEAAQNLSRAMTDSADVLQDSVSKFSKTYHREQDKSKASKTAGKK